METSDQWDGLDAAYRLRGAADRSDFAEREVSLDLITTVCIGPQHIQEMSLVKNQAMIETLAPDRSDETLAATILPG